MPTHEIKCSCEHCGCQNVVGTTDLPEDADHVAATSGYLCKQCGFTDIGVEQRRWLEITDVIPNTKVRSPLAPFGVLVREPFKEVRTRSNELFTIELVDSDGNPDGVPFLMGKTRWHLQEGRVQVSGLYVAGTGSFMLRISADGYDPIYSTTFEVT